MRKLFVTLGDPAGIGPEIIAKCLAGISTGDVEPVVVGEREILEETARVMGLRHPRMIEVPLLTPRLSSLWVRFVTRANWSVAREVVVGLVDDLLARDDQFWRLIDHPNRLTFAEAARVALSAEERVIGTWGAIEHVRGLRERQV